MNEPIQAGFIGLGAMGAPMAAHLANAGLLSAVWNRSVEKAHGFATTHGVTAATSPADLAAACNVILLCVSADDDLQVVIDAMQSGLSEGALVIDHSTVAPDTARRIAAHLADQGVAFLDAPVSGGVEGARNGNLSIMIGGDSAALEQARPVLDCYAARISHMGAAGNGQATKAVNQVLVAGIAEAVCEGLALSERLELPADALLQVLQNGAAGSWFLDKRGATMLADDCDTGFKLELLIKDLGICRQIAESAQLKLSGVDRAMDDYCQCLANGDGDQDISALIRLKRKQLTGDD